jgi:hypothetical protein
MKKLLCTMALLAVAWPAMAEDVIPLPRPKPLAMTCTGALRPERVAYCHFDDATIGVEKIWKACEVYEPCVLRVIINPTTSMIIQVYSAKGRSK